MGSSQWSSDKPHHLRYEHAAAESPTAEGTRPRVTTLPRAASPLHEQHRRKEPHLRGSRRHSESCITVPRATTPRATPPRATPPRAASPRQEPHQGSHRREGSAGPAPPEPHCQQPRRNCAHPLDDVVVHPSGTVTPTPATTAAANEVSFLENRLRTSMERQCSPTAEIRTVEIHPWRCKSSEA